jgi:hypothetical protein
MDKRIAGEILSRLDSTAKMVEDLRTAGKVDPKEADELLHNIDGFADRFEIAVGGREAFEARQAKVIKRDSDEPWMDTFENPQKPIQVEPDEPYMHETGKSFNCDSIPTYDSDDTSQVTDRKEYAVRDLSEHADGTKQQPSWTSGPAGKSTKQGSTKPKTWAT